MKNNSIEPTVINGSKREYVVKGIYHINNINIKKVDKTI